MNRKVSICFIIVLFVPLMAKAQDTIVPEYKNSMKWNAMGMIFQNISLLYERSLSPHWTAQLGVGYKWGGDVPKVIGRGDILITSDQSGIGGITLTPEVRYYFNFCQCGGAPSGLYAGLYGRYTRYNADLNINFWDGSAYVDVAVANNFREMGLGIQIGYQFIFKERFLVDLMFAGPRLNNYKINFTMDSDYVGELAPIIEDEINKRREWLGMDPISIDPSSSGEVEAQFGFKAFRYAVGIGFQF